ncbi:MAG: hypothetical protein H6R26_297 [Proteobacteria bacterium]|nr:hypothetical protein [Pseudomonadota bacterium]
MFVKSANEFCELIEQIESHEPAPWLAAMGAILLRLDTAIAHLVEVTPAPPHVWLTDMEKRFELYSRLKAFLGELDEYWSEADLHASDGYMTGSLSDDFSDIYFELKRGLIVHRQGYDGQEQAILLWTSSYQHHWRQHLVDARKQLLEFRPRTPAAGRKPPVRAHKPPKKPA